MGLIFCSARLITIDPRNPEARTVAVKARELPRLAMTQVF